MQSNSSGAGEFNPRPTNAGGSEFQGAPSAPAKKKKSSLQLKITSFMVGTAAVAVVGGTELVPLFSPEAEITALTATDTAITYTVNVEEEDAEGLIVVAYKDFVRREAPLGAGLNEGVFKDLKPQMRYTVAVENTSGMGGTVARDSIVTLSPDKVPVTALYSVSHECTCNIDGCFHFTMELEDGRGIWSEYAASLTDKNGTVSECVFTDDISAEQSIDVVGAHLVGQEARFAITCYDSSVEGRITLYECKVKI